MTRVRCPGHITGFFEICRSKIGDARYTGSRGAGVCIDKGVETTVSIKGSGGTTIRINGELEIAPVTQSVINSFLRLINKDVAFEINHKIEVPISAGFGASGAGALSTAFALNKELNLNMSRNAVATIAHIAEVESQTGLGDVIAQTYGGVEIRTEPGAPGIGRIDQILTDPSLQVLCINLGKLETKAVLTNPAQQNRINQAGKILVSELLKNVTVENLLRLSKKFMEESELASEGLKELLQYITGFHRLPFSMVMLGESLFTFIKKEEGAELQDEVQAYSSKLNVFICDIDFRGPKLVEAQ
ncbi:MAG TPA: pantoate kinase [Candidatus Deferrimicrobium sp.]|nr:pantoate kinase [Candidatus Deferrimicrobium sp.]